MAADPELALRIDPAQSTTTTGDSGRPGQHLFILVHGFGGRRYDLHLVQKTIAYEHPKAMFMHSASNEGKTDGSLAQMGSNLASEINKFI